MLKDLVAKFVRDQLIPLEPAVLARDAAGESIAHHRLPIERLRLPRHTGG